MAPDPAWVNVNIGGGGAFPQAAAGPDGSIAVTSDVAGLCLSRDGGATFLTRGQAHGLNDQNLYAAWWDPDDPLRLYIGGEGGTNHKGLLKSVNGGDTFTEINQVGFFTSGMTAPSDHDKVYALFHGSSSSLDPQVLKSTNRGTSWSVAGALPTGQRGLKLLVDPGTPSTLYVVTGLQPPLVSNSNLPQRVYKSVDSGATWTQIGPSGMPAAFDFAVDPAVPTTVYMSTIASGTYRSQDRGATWGAQLTPHTGCITIPDTPAALMAVIKPSDVEFKDEADGTGSVSDTPPLSGPSTDYALISYAGSCDDIADPGAIKHVIFKVRPRITNPLTGTDPAAITQPKICYSTTPSNQAFVDPLDAIPTEAGWVESGPVAVDAAGSPWTLAALNGLERIGVRVHFFNDTTPWPTTGTMTGRLEVLEAEAWVYGQRAIILNNPVAPSSSDAGTWKSLDGGATWQHYPKSGWDAGWKPLLGANGNDAYGTYGQTRYGLCTTIGRDMSNPLRFFWVTSQFVYVTDDGGITFRNLFTDLKPNGRYRGRGIDCLEITALSSSGLVIYGGAYDVGAVRSDDGGDTWKSINTPTYGWADGYGGNVLTILADPVRANVVWMALANNAVGPYTLLRSVNSGDTWTAVLNAASGQVMSGLIMGLELDPSSSQSNRTLYVTLDGNVYKSTDDGQHWTLFRSTGGLRAVSALGANIFVGGEAGLWRTTNGGTSWTQMDSAKFSVGTTATIDMIWKGVRAILQNNGNVYACYYGGAASSGKGLYKSADNGATWALELSDDWSRAIVGDLSGNLYHASSKAAKAGQNASVGSTGVKRWKVLAGAWDSLMGGTSWPESAWPLTAHPTNAFLIAGFPGLGFQRLLAPATF